MYELNLPVVLQLPDNYYEILKEIAEANNETPEKVARGLVGHAIEEALFFKLEMYRQQWKQTKN